MAKNITPNNISTAEIIKAFDLRDPKRMDLIRDLEADWNNVNTPYRKCLDEISKIIAQNGTFSYDGGTVYLEETRDLFDDIIDSFSIDEIKQYCYEGVFRQETGAKDIKAFFAQNPDYLESCVQRYPQYFQFVDPLMQTPQLSLEAVNRWPDNIAFVREQTEYLCALAVSKDGMALEYIQNQTPALRALAVQNNPRALTLVEEQTPELCKIAFNESPFSIQYMKNPTREMCEFAVYMASNQDCNFYLKGFEEVLPADLFQSLLRDMEKYRMDDSTPQKELERLQNLGVSTEAAKEAIRGICEEKDIVATFDDEIPLTMIKTPEEWVSFLTQAGVDPEKAANIVENARKDINQEENRNKDVTESPIIGSED